MSGNGYTFFHMRMLKMTIIPFLMHDVSYLSNRKFNAACHIRHFKKSMMSFFSKNSMGLCREPIMFAGKFTMPDNLLTNSMYCPNIHFDVKRWTLEWQQSDTVSDVEQSAYRRKKDKEVHNWN